MEQPQLLVLDEPTNHLDQLPVVKSKPRVKDIYSIEALSVALAEFKGAVLLITHNRDVLRKVAKDTIPLTCIHETCTVASKSLNYAPYARAYNANFPRQLFL
ncbi:ybiT, partial [Symbiodinium pilosum]